MLVSSRFYLEDCGCSVYKSNPKFYILVCKSKSWIEENRDTVIGVAVGAGLLLILFLWCCCCRRNR
jgi:hypothetical protein